MAKYCPYCVSKVEQGNTCPYCNYAYTYRPKAHHLQPGTILHDKYLVGRVLGEGGFGITYVGRDLTLDMKVAIKEYYPRTMAQRQTTYDKTVSLMNWTFSADFKEGKEQFINEAQTIAKMDKESAVVTVRDFFESNNSAYIVMEFVEGDDLKTIIQKEQRAFTPEELLPVLEPVFGALGELHNIGLIHRDISPDNIMIEDGRARLIDFGCARETMGDDTEAALKHGFSPVEQYENKNMGPWTDVYAMAATIYYCLTGRLPQLSTERRIKDNLALPTSLGVRLSKRQERALMKALAVDPEERYQSMEEFGKDLFVHKNRYKTIAIVACVLAVAAAASVFVFKPSQVVETMKVENPVEVVLSLESEDLGKNERAVLEEITNEIRDNGILVPTDNNYYKIDMKNTTDYSLQDVQVKVSFYDNNNALTQTNSSSVDKWEKGAVTSPSVYCRTQDLTKAQVRVLFTLDGSRLQTEYIEVPIGKDAESAVEITLITDLPVTFKCDNYRGHFEYEISGFRFSVSNYRKDTYYVELYFEGTALSTDTKESNYGGFTYKLRDEDGVLVNTGNASMPGLDSGERFKNLRSYVGELPAGFYTLELTEYVN